MKSREEYKASIFAKRDALLAKRKRTALTIAATGCVAVCFITAAAFLPKNISSDIKIYDEPEHTTTQAVQATEVLAEEKTEAEIYTLGVIYTTPPHTKPHYSETQTNTTHYAGIVHVTEPAESPAIEVEDGAATAEKTTKKSYGFSPEWMQEGFEFYEESEVVTPDSSDGFTEDEIIQKAKSCLSAELEDKIIEKHNMVTVSRYADGTEIYTVWFYTDTEQIKVELDSKNLELIETTVKPLGDIQTTPAYIPTTAASPYIPE